MPPKLTQEQARTKVKTYNNEYELISEYKTQKEKVILRHSCGHGYSVIFKTFFENKNKCPKCYPTNTNKGKNKIAKVTEEILKQRIKEQVDIEYEYISGFTTMDKKTSIFKHNECGKTFLVAPKMFLGVKQTRCPHCANKKRGEHLRDENYLQDILDSSSDGNNYQWLQSYNNDNKQKLLIKHLECNRDYRVRPNDFQQGYRCPYCSSEKNESEGSKNIRLLLDDSNVEYRTEISFKDLKYKESLKFDYIIDNIIIEFDGEQHFKSYKSGYFADKYLIIRKRDQIKNEWIKNNNYHFIRIPYTVPLDSLELIITSIIEGTLTDTIINHFKLYVYKPDTKIVLNEKSYYESINKDYFNEI